MPQICCNTNFISESLQLYWLFQLPEQYQSQSICDLIALLSDHCVTPLTPLGTVFLFQVLVLRELAVSAPTFFFQQVQPFFDNIFYAVWDSKQAIREGAVSALRACLILTTQRETKEMQKPQWYKVRINTALTVFKYVCMNTMSIWALTHSMYFFVINSKHLRKPRRVLMKLWLKRKA